MGAVDLQQVVDLWYMAVTVWGEARGEGAKGMEYVAWVIRNRCRRYGKPVREIVTAPHQFSCWNANDPNRKLLADPMAGSQANRIAFLTALQTAYRVLTADESQNPLPGVYWYYARTIPRPKWAEKLEVVHLPDAGNHIFLREPRKEARA